MQKKFPNTIKNSNGLITISVLYTHAFVSLSAIPVGMYIFFTKKGTKQHRFIGRIRVSFMFIICFSALFIISSMTEKLLLSAGFSWIYLLILWTIDTLIYSNYSILLFKKIKLEKAQQCKYSSDVINICWSTNCYWSIHPNAHECTSPQQNGQIAL